MIPGSIKPQTSKISRHFIHQLPHIIRHSTWQKQRLKKAESKNSFSYCITKSLNELSVKQRILHVSNFLTGLFTYTVKPPLSIIPVCVNFPEIFFISPDPEKSPTRARCNYSRFITHPSVFSYFSHYSWSWPTIFLPWSILNVMKVSLCGLCYPGQLPRAAKTSPTQWQKPEILQAISHFWNVQ